MSAAAQASATASPVSGIAGCAPGGVRSGGPIKLDSPETLRAKEEKVPLKHYCEPREISYAVAYLASPESDFVTGQVISPNGGETVVGY